MGGHPPEKWYDPIADKHVLINRHKTSRRFSSPFVNMAGTGLDMGYIKSRLLEHKLNRTVLISKMGWVLGTRSSLYTSMRAMGGKVP